MPRGRKPEKTERDVGIFFRSGVWWAEVWVGSGKARKRYREKVGPSKEQAKERVEEMRTMLRAGHVVPTLRRIPTVEAACRDFIETTGSQKKSLVDDQRFARIWTTVLGSHLLTMVTPEMVEKYKIAWADEGLTVATVNRRLSFLRRIFNVAKRNGLHLENPVALVGLYPEDNSRERYLTPEELVRLRETMHPKYWLLVVFAIETGMRQGELLRMVWEDIDWMTCQVKIPLAKHKKRFVPLSDLALEILKQVDADYRKAAKVPNIWTSPKGYRVNADTFRARFFDPAVKAAGIDNFTFHDLRHTQGSLLTMLGYPPQTVAKILGHVDVRMAQRYSHMSNQHTREAVNKLAAFHQASIEPKKPTVENDTPAVKALKKLRRRAHTRVTRKRMKLKRR